MTSDEDLAAIRARAVRALEHTDIVDLFQRWRAVIGPPPEQMSELAQAALGSLQNMQKPTPEQMQALEQAIRLLRPAVLIQGGELRSLDTVTATAFPAWEAFRDAVRRYLAVIGRIDQVGVRKFNATPIGTGFLIAPTHLVTNRHVVDVLTLGTGLLTYGQAEVRFGQEYGWSSRPEPAPVPVLEVQAIHEELDLAVLRIELPPFEVLPIPVDNVPVTSGMQVAALGYPTKDDRIPPSVMIQFDNRFNVKRGSPGEIVSTRKEIFFHDCTTLGGNSGSPVLTLDDARLVGVHSDGLFLARNRALTGASVMAFLSAASEGGRQ